MTRVRPEGSLRRDEVAKMERQTSGRNRAEIPSSSSRRSQATGSYDLRVKHPGNSEYGNVRATQGGRPPGQE